MTLETNVESATDPHRRVKGFARAVWQQRAAVDAGQSAFAYEHTAGGQHTQTRQTMSADAWLEHLRVYDPRWNGAIAKGVVLDRSVSLERALLLRRVEMFAALDEVLLAEIGPYMGEVELAEGEQLFAEGDQGDEMYVVATGCLQIVRGGTPLVERGATEIVGELAVLDPAPRSAGAIALEPTRLLSLEREQLLTVMADHPAILRGVVRTLCRRLR